LGCYSQLLDFWLPISMRPLLVFLHGFGEDARIWQDFFPEKFADYEIHVPNFACWSNCHSIASYASKIVSEIPTNIPFICIGHSMGGYIALEIAQQFPQRTKAIVMLHSTPLPDSLEKKTQRLKTVDFLQEHGSEIFIRSFVANLFAPDFVKIKRDLIDQLIFRYQNIDVMGLVAATRAMKDRQDFQEFIRYTSIPFLFVLGEIDPLIPPSSIVGLLEGKDQHKFVILPGVAHQGCYEASEQTFLVINQFLNEIHV